MNQFGFKKSHSTSHAINHSIGVITEQIEKRQHVIGIFIDLSKAFDTINHDILLAKLSNYGTRGIILQLIVTNFNGDKSELGTVVYGVPQGSVLGPLLFLLYINDITNCSHSCEFILFADDTNIFISAESETEVYKLAYKTISRMRLYMISNQLHINLSKCTYIHFKPNINIKERLSCARTQTHVTHTLHIGVTKLKKVDKARFLGVIIDEKLTWDDHINYIESKLLSCIATIKHI